MAVPVGRGALVGVEVGDGASAPVAVGVGVSVRVGLGVWMGVGPARRRLALPQTYDDTEQHAQSRQQTKRRSA